MTSTQNDSGGVGGPPLSDDEQAALAQISSDPAFYPASVAAPVAHALYQMVREHRPRVCVEVGCHLGFSTIYLAKALKENGEGKLVVFDLHTGCAAGQVAGAGLAEWVRFEDGPSAERLPARLAGVSDVGLAFVDGGHTRRGCLADFSALFPHLAEQACVVLHDIYPDRCGWFGPRLLLDMFRRARAYDHMAQFDIEERADLDRYGVAICYMREVGADPVAASNLLQRLELFAMRSHLTAVVENAWFQSERSWPGALGELGKLVVRRALKPLIPR